MGVATLETGTPLTRKLLTAVGVLLALIVVVGVVGEFAGPRLVESRIEERIRANTGSEVTVEADVRSSAFLPVLFAQGRIHRMAITLDGATGQPLPLTMRFLLEGVTLSRQGLLTGRAELRDVDAGNVTVELSQRRISAAMGITTDINQDRMVLGPASVGLIADVTSEGRTVTISNESFENLKVPLPESLLPCAEPEMELADGVVRLFCETERLPAVLIAD